MKKRNLFLALVMVMIFTLLPMSAFAADVVAEGTCGGNLTWTLDSEGTLTISGTGAMTDYSYVSKAPWFNSRSSIKSVTIGNSVTSIGDLAFYDCDGLAKVTIPDSVTGIGNFAFFNCSSVTGITIGNGVTRIGDSAFRNCSSLTGITLPNCVSSIGDYVFADCSRLTGITIPNSVTGVGSYAFFNCGSLTDITIPNSVTSIGDYAFEYCSSLIGITLPEGVASIGTGAFSDCSSLISITIPNSVTRISNGAFYNCSSLTSITIPDSVTSIGSSAFMYCSSLYSVHFSGDRPTIETDAFYNHYGSTLAFYPKGNETYPESGTNSENLIWFVDGEPSDVLDFGTCGNGVVWQITRDGCLTVSGLGKMDSYHNEAPWYAYRGGITRLLIMSGISSIGDCAFYDCTKLTSVTISNSVASIGESAFFNCISLIDITIPDGVTCIGNSAFARCSSLTNITIPDSVTSIGEYAFNSFFTNLAAIEVSAQNPNYCSQDGVLFNKDCTKLICYPGGRTGSYVIPDGVTSIGNYAFYCCSSLTDITIPDSVIRIGDFAFYYCSSLSSITIPNGVTSIGSYAFEGCSSLYSVRFLGDKPTIRTQAFYNDSTGPAFAFYPKDNETYPKAGSDSDLIWFADGEPSDVLVSGTCGDGVVWQITRDGCLTVSGLGKMDSYHNQAPWHAYRGGITRLLIMSGVRDIGDYALYGCTKLTGVTIPNSVTGIGDHAFDGCRSLKNAYYIGSIAQWSKIAIGSDNCALKNAIIHYCKHSYVSFATQPTCTQSGYTTHICTICSDRYIDTYTDTLGHDYEDVVTVPTCTEQGYTMHVCTRCNDSYVDSCVDALGHDFGAWTETKAATSSEKGEERRDCSRCEYYETREVEVLGHDYKATVTDPTCTEQGYTTHTCSRCEDSYVDTYVDALGHDLGEWTETKAAICTEKGAERRDCSRCEYYETREIEALGHDYKAIVTDPTCTEQGYTTHACSRCDDSYVDTYVDALGHDLGEWTETKAATCTEKGAERRDCSRCEHYETREIEVLGHDYKDTVTTPTCTEQGYTTHTCSRCEDSYVDTYVDALGHDLGEWTETKAATCTEKGAERRDCSRCEHYETREVEAHGHNYKDTVTDPTCTEQGYTTHTCSRCSDSYVDTYVDALGHVWDDGVVTKQPTATENGVKTFTCTRCGETRTETIPATGDKPCDGGADCPSGKFVDVNPKEWYHPYVDYAVEHGLFGGTSANTFEPETAMTRAMLVTVLWRYEGKPMGYQNTFVDVNAKSGSWYIDAVAWAAANNIVGGIGNGKFDPEGKITREQMATILFRYANWKGIDTSKRGDLSVFPDANRVSSYAKDAVQWAVGEKIINGSDGKLLPQGSATRAQVATILMRFIENIVNK